jgi:(p)ppGpp synthase/HD superfamily hydrolase
MATRTAVPTDVQTPTSLARSALSFAARCHAGQRRESDGAPFIEHPSEVARLLRDSGCSSDVVAAGILHKVVEDTDVGLAELTARFGPEIANLVQAVTDDSVGSYRERKQALRDRVDHAGGDVALLFAADKIAEVRELADQVRSERARFGANAREARARDRLERFQQMRLEHYRQSLRMLERVAPRHPLVRQLATELDRCPIAGRRRALPPNPFDPDASA